MGQGVEGEKQEEQGTPDFFWMALGAFAANLKLGYVHGTTSTCPTGTTSTSTWHHLAPLAGSHVHLGTLEKPTGHPWLEAWLEACGTPRTMRVEL